jgi:hypothetical protein
MELFFLLLMLSAFGTYTLKAREQARRIKLLASHLGKHQLEKLMESLTEGYLRALGEKDPERQQQVWRFLAQSESELCAQFRRFVADFSKVDAAQTRVSKLALFIPFADRLLAGASFDLRQALAIHAQGICQAVENSRGLSLKAKAFTLSAELYLMQHSCHWFCRSKTVASARLLARHKTSYEQVLASVAPETRAAYGALVGVATAR